MTVVLCTMLVTCSPLYKEVRTWAMEKFPTVIQLMDPTTNVAKGAEEVPGTDTKEPASI